jgi:peptidoglycan/LPS O-acetylase OafA/YrhL
MPQNLKPLTAMRYFAAMWVVAYHYWPSLGLVRPTLVEKGYLGVELFFVLSGFILSHVYLPAFGARRYRYADFLWARLARIYPVHLVTLAGMGLMVFAAGLVGVQSGDHALVWSSLPAQLTLTQAWGLAPQGGWNHPSWSISAEWFAYLTFPAFAIVAWALRNRPLLAIGLAMVTVAVLDIVFERLAGFPLTQATLLWGALRIVPCFLLGCAVYLLWSAHPLRSRLGAPAGVAAVLVAIIAACQLGAPDWLTVILFGGLIFTLASLASAGSDLLSSPVWVYLGEVSFAVYMVCIPWQLAFEKGAHKLLGLNQDSLPLAAWVVMILGVTPAAMVIHHLVERPAREAMRRHGVPFSRRRPKAAAEPQLAMPTI